MDWRIEVAQHAAERRAIETHREMSRGLFGLATVAAAAPFVGFIGVVLGIVNSFPALGTDKMTALAVTAGRLSNAMAPAALSVGIAVAALAAYRSFTATVSGFDHEMRTAILELTNVLARR